jgi:hypothetical protein
MFSYHFNCLPEEPLKAIAWRQPLALARLRLERFETTIYLYVNRILGGYSPAPENPRKIFK